VRTPPILFTPVAHHFSLAYVLNLRGQDIPYNPFFFAYLFIGLDRVVLFIDGAKLNDDVNSYLRNIGVETKEYNDLWQFLRTREWGEGKVCVTMIQFCPQKLMT
jgi:Xaa-Pro aminopeptidase